MNKLLERFLSKKQIKQHTPEWYQKRDFLVTASKAAGFLECSQYGPSLTQTELKDLAKTGFSIDDTNDTATSFGTHHEDIARKALEIRLSSQIHELGLALHPNS